MLSLDRRSFLKTTAASLALLPARRATAAPADEDPLGVRADFPVVQSHTYLNTASVGPLSRAARDAGIAYVDESMTAPFAARRSERREQAREGFAELFGAKKEEIAFLYSTSDGENIVASGLDLKAGDNIVIDELHFTTSFVLFRQLEKEKGIELRIVPEKDGRTRLEDFDAQIDARTRLVSVAWVSNRNGFRQDLRGLAELTHRKGALLYADAVQAMGHFPTNLKEEGVDFLTTNSYKWLFSSFGAAPFFVREDQLERLTPDRYGHGSAAKSLPDYHFELRDDASKYEYATPAYNVVYQLAASLDYLKTVGLERIETHSVALARELRDGVAHLGFETWTPKGNASPIVSFAHGRNTEEVAKLFEKEGILVTFRENEGSVVRVAVALFNNRGDIQKLLKVLQQIA